MQNACNFEMVEPIESLKTILSFKSFITCFQISWLFANELFIEKFWFCFPSFFMKTYNSFSPISHQCFIFKHPKNLAFSVVLIGYRNGTLTWWVKTLCRPLRNFYQLKVLSLRKNSWFQLFLNNLYKFMVVVKCLQKITPRFNA